jgi:formate--tetrahydrofolate ligase
MGFPNLERHLQNGKVYGVPTIVAVNRFTSDTDEEVQAVIDHCKSMGVDAHAADYWKDGGKGGTGLAEAVVNQAHEFSGSFTPVYDLQQSVEEKINAVAKKIYGAAKVDFAGPAKADMRLIEKLGLSNLPICIAKTQSSLSDDPKRRGRPEGFGIEVREIEIAAGAGFLIPITGKMMRMPGLPETPASENIDIDKNGKISGLF